MTQKNTFNALPEDESIYDGEQRRRTEFDSDGEKFAHDANGLIAKAKERYKKQIVTVAEAFDLRSRIGEDFTPESEKGLKCAIAVEIKNPEVVEIDERLIALVVDPINALSEAQRTVKGKVRSGEEIARAIPDMAAFLDEVNLQKKDGILLDFFELNEAGQLVMKDDCEEAYDLGENVLQARMRQTCIVYAENGQTEVMTGEEYFNVTRQDGEGIPLEMEVSQVAAQKMAKQSILMARGLPTLKLDGNKHIGEYARMNTGQLERRTCTWTDDDSLDASRARDADWSGGNEVMESRVNDSNCQVVNLGSRGVLRVNLNFES
ncbi:MAG: hypothetical protein AAB540_02250 [Patescibacteria group bacterium]